jgi:hypothetical protein
VISLIFRLFRLPMPLVIGLMVVRSDLFRRSVRLAWRNRGLVTRSGRQAVTAIPEIPGELRDPAIDLVR